MEPLAEAWRAIHHLHYTSPQNVNDLIEVLPGYQKAGLNTIIFEIDYNFAYKSHPELLDEPHLTKADIQKLKKACDQHKIRLIPQFQSFGHQSWKATTYALLRTYPELDLTPGAHPGNEGIYCREWDPYDDKLYRIILPLLDELIDAFECEYMHFGMDEVFLINDPASKTRDNDPADVFAKAVTMLHDHVTYERGVTMMIWGDRLLDAKAMGGHEWESAANGTHPAIDMIPKDIIMCDWHYGEQEKYPSVPFFLSKGFKVLPTGWNKVEASNAFIKYAHSLDHPNMMGHLFSTWSGKKDYLEWPPVKEGLKLIKQLESKTT